MAYPTIYNVTYSYTGFQQAQQGISAFPGTQLDADLAGLKSSIAGLAAFTERTVRSDGALNNGIVGYDSLSPALQTAGIAPGVAWATGTFYLPNVAVFENGNLYRVVTAHTSGVFLTDLAAGRLAFVVSLPAGPIPDVATHALAAAQSYPAVQVIIRTAGYYAAGDGGGATYKRVVAQPSHTGKIQTTDGVWWEIVVEPNGFVYAEQFGATGGVDATVAINNACVVSQFVGFLRATYLVSATILARPGATLKSFCRDGSLLLRSTVYGPTVQIGTSGQSNNAGACTIDGLYFNKTQAFNNGATYVAGTSTSITNIETNPHIVIYKAQNVAILNCRLNNAGGLRFYGCSLIKVDNCVIGGMWDSAHAGLQECFANIAAIDYTDSDTTHYINTELKVSNCFLSGAGHTESRSNTVGNATFSQAYNFGSAYGIYSNCSEGVDIHDNYIGGNNMNNILLSAATTTSHIRIHHNFIDGARNYSIRLEGGVSGNYPNMISVDHNTGVGYGLDDGFLYCADLQSSPSATNMVVEGNVVQYYLRAPFRFDHCHGALFRGNIVRAYNSQNSTDGAVLNSAGCIATNCDDFHAEGNSYGGAVNDPIGGNNCQYGSSLVTCTNSTTTNEHGTNLGLAGGYVTNGTAPGSIFGDIEAQKNGGVPNIGLRRTDAHGSAQSVGQLEYLGKDSAGNDQAYGAIVNYVDDNTSGSEDSAFLLNTMVGGVYTTVGYVRGGLQLGAGATGGDPGIGSVNVSVGYKVNNAPVYYSGGTDVALVDGGTGSSTAAGARTNLGLGTAAVATLDTDATLAANSDGSISSQKAVKSYVDNAVTGLFWKPAVLIATVANITLSGEQTIDGVLTSASRVLVKNQGTATQNGVYVSAAGAWSRALDMDAAAEFPSATIMVEKGALNADTQWTCGNDAVTVGSTNVVFVQISGAGTYSAGTGLSLSGNQFSVGDAELLALAGLVSAADQVPYFTGLGAAALATFTAAGRAMAGAADAAAQLVLLGLSALFAAWTAYTPTVGAQVGTFTTASGTGTYLKIGKTVWFQFKVTITTNGTAATAVTATLPFPALNNDFAWSGRANGVSGKLLIGYNSVGGAGTVYIQNYDATYPGSNGEVLVFSGTYQST